MGNCRWILASGSPRRKKLLQMLEVPFEVIVPDVLEEISGKSPDAVTEELSRRKAQAVAQQISDGIVIGADTVVSADGIILGKPSSKEDAKRMLRFLQGRSHMVYTGVTLIKKNCRESAGESEIRTFSVGTRVYISALTEEEIERYAMSGDSLDKAGAYGIQGVFGRHISGIEGDYYNVEGLPVNRIYEELKRWDE